ncbi:hypothetical protein C8035_v008394 [Colletotrichum spinosum]|uniref:Uncharacterized protein n=1 Tax=Colletotrichum spinosum TaxID=1347390 RepID=A0A4R8QIH6_9PEZI|nr:hypothetical protein C8035_v008394 [Colletotrichum spinosum]
MRHTTVPSKPLPVAQKRSNDSVAKGREWLLGRGVLGAEGGRLKPPTPPKLLPRCSIPDDRADDRSSSPRSPES